MHEMSICQGLIRQVEKIAQDKGAGRVDRVVISIGPLAGVEPTDTRAGESMPPAVSDTFNDLLEALPLVCGQDQNKERV